MDEVFEFDADDNAGETSQEAHGSTIAPAGIGYGTLALIKNTAKAVQS
jgi:hypothetical protein